MAAGCDSIVAVATAPGKGGIGIVRASGSDLGPMIAGIIGISLEPRRALLARFLNSQGEAIDQGLAIFFKGPASFTGQDTLELHGHGGPVVLQMLLERCIELGARPAQPGEFTQRAFLNDKMDLAQAEAVADLIDANTSVSARCAMRSLSGEFSMIIESFVAQLIELRMVIEASLDFPDEEIDFADRSQIFSRLERLRAEIGRALDRGRRGSILRTGLNVVIAGRPNMGKSSLLNALAGEDLAIVTPVPGTTRDAIRQSIQIEGVPINFIDTAGLRDTPDEIEVLGITRTWEMIERADVVMVIVEAASGVLAEDEEIFAKLPNRVPRIIVRNKLDLIGDEPSRTCQGNSQILSLSAKTGKGLNLLQSALLEIIGWHPGGEDVFMARARHLDALVRASRFLDMAAAVVMQSELFAEELRLAQNELCTITGDFVADDLLGEIFSRFCIGK